MCGIFGIMQHGATRAPSEALLAETRSRLQHRGPDGFGIHADVGIGLVHTRLSLVDLSERANQPMWDASGRYALLYNGELYGYDRLRSDLEASGARFRTTSDTEVLLEALIRLGVDETLERIDGMFAFALYDAERRSLTLARDRFGIKPLFVHDSDEAFIFASSVSAMQPWLELEPDPLMARAFFHGFNGPMSGRSFYRNVTIVPPGSVIRVEPGGRVQYCQRLTMRDLFDPDEAADLADRPRSELVDRVEAILLESVEQQLIADAPVGAFCSGGVDSSLILSMAARFHSDLRVFHADIVGPLSERPAAEHLAKHLGLRLEVATVRDTDFVSRIPDVVEHFGAPFMNPTTVPVLMVSELVREQGVKAVLTGEASDECYLGYPWLVPNIPQALRRVSRRVLGTFQPGSNGTTLAAGGDRALVDEISSGFEAFAGPAVPAYEAVEDYQASSPDGLTSDAELSYILRTLLYRNDTMGMAASVESRFPFLDRRLVALSANLPTDCKVRFSPFALDREHPFYRDKWIIRQIADRYVPRELSRRNKGMFPTNAFGRIRVDDGFFDNSFTSDFFGLPRARMTHLLEQASDTLRLRMMIFESWARVAIQGCAKEEFRERLVRHAKVLPLGSR